MIVDSLSAYTWGRKCYFVYLGNQMIPILMYHQIDMPPPKGVRLRGSTVHPKHFETQMRWLKRLGYKGLALKELMPYVAGEKKGKVVGITFDDGYQNVYQNALPVLTKLGFSSTNFIVTGQLGGKNQWAQDNGSYPSRLMDIEQIRDWHTHGQEIGSHTVDHIYLADTPKEQALVQLKQSKSTLENILQTQIVSFCYPYGNESLEARQWVAKAGYKMAVSTQRGLVRQDDDLFALPRINILRSTHLLHFLRKTLTQYEEKKRAAKD